MGRPVATRQAENKKGEKYFLHNHHHSTDFWFKAIVHDTSCYLVIAAGERWHATVYLPGHAAPVIVYTITVIP